jgi:periplasmic protein TonB
MLKSILTIALVLFTLSFVTAQSGQDDKVETPSPVIFNIVDSPPEYVGGETALYTFIYQRLKFPVDLEMRECTVYVGFVVNEDGSLSNIAVKRGFGRDYNQAAVKVIEAMPKWRAGRHQGELKKVAKVLPIRFKVSQ